MHSTHTHSLRWRIATILLVSFLLSACDAFPIQTPALPPTGSTSIPAGSTVTPDPTPLPGRQHGDSQDPAISPDGRWVVFASRSGDLIQEALPEALPETLPECRLVEAEPRNCLQIFVYDRQAGEMALVSRSSQGAPGGADSRTPEISTDGRWVVFASQAQNLAPGQPMGRMGVFLHDRRSGETRLVSPDSYGPSISADGRFVAFDRLDGFWSAYLYDRETGAAVEVSAPPARLPEGIGRGNSLMAEVSGDGRWVAFWSWAAGLVSPEAPADQTPCDDPGPNARCGDVYLYERETGRLLRVTANASWIEGMIHAPLSLSGDGRLLAFLDRVYDRQSGQVGPLCTGEAACAGGVLSGKGQWLAAAGEAEIWLHDRSTGRFLRAGALDDGTPGDALAVESVDCGEGRCVLNRDFDLSEDGRWLVFNSSAGNLATGDTQLCAGQGSLPYNCVDIFIYDREMGKIDWISKGD